MALENLDVYKKLELFIKYNLVVKKITYNLAPQYWTREIDFYNYIENLKQNLNELERIFKTINRLEIFIEDYTHIGRIFDECQKDLLNIKPNFASVSSYYEKHISKMDETLIYKVRREYIGYKFMPSEDLLSEANTINEAMFIIHAKINNSTFVYESIPTIETKNNSENYPITLRGRETLLAKNIFDAISCDIKLGWTDIISFGDSNKILMMIRDRGHATTIEITWTNNIVDVDYFIPKACNYLMINKLKGIRPIKEDADYAIGRFRTNVEECPMIISELISGIPMDEHMDIEGGKFYNR